MPASDGALGIGDRLQHVRSHPGEFTVFLDDVGPPLNGDVRMLRTAVGRSPLG